ncbi:MAG: hypothetical protein ACK41T_05190 [Pseudobdellovibrio sp.]
MAVYKPSLTTKSCAKDGAVVKKEFHMVLGLNELLMFCGLYSSLVIYSLWITVADRAVRAQQKIYTKE